MGKTYYIAGKAIVDNHTFECYYTIQDYWVTDISNTDIEYFKSAPEAEARIKNILELTKIGASFKKLISIYIKNSNDKIVQILWERK